MVVATAASRHSIAQIRVSLTGEAAHTLADSELEQLRLNIPAARSLPLLQALARSEATHVILEYLDQTHIAMELIPC